MNSVAPLAMFGWIPVVFLLFALLPPRRAVIVAFIVGWLFLPQYTVKLQDGIPAYSRIMATCVGTLLAACVFDGGRVLAFRPKWIDLPMLVWCLCPFASSMSNDLGWHDGVSAVADQIIMWGVPYFIGRLYFQDAAGLRELAIGIFVGGLVYMPLCLYEIRMSPQLHRLVYGFALGDFSQSKRFGGFRPVVFMAHSLMVGMWMVNASVTGIWLRVTLRQIFGIPLWWLLVPLLVTTALCKAIGALVLLLAGVLVLELVRRLKSWVPIWCLIAIIPAYMGFRATGGWGGASVVTISQSLFGQDRADSLNYRLRNEDILAAKALERPVFGWGRWGRARVYNDEGDDLSTTDGLWIIVLGQAGVLGLTACFGAMLLPGILLLRRCLCSGRPLAPASAVALVVLLTLFMIDSLMNGFVNPIFILVAGALGGLTIANPSNVGKSRAVVADGGAGSRSLWKNQVWRRPGPSDTGATT
jgi:hypothetical protein